MPEESILENFIFLFIGDLHTEISKKPNYELGIKFSLSQDKKNKLW